MQIKECVNDKVVHLVTRPPPSLNRGSASNNTRPTSTTTTTNTGGNSTAGGATASQDILRNFAPETALETFNRLYSLALDSIQRIIRHPHASSCPGIVELCENLFEAENRPRESLLSSELPPEEPMRQQSAVVAIQIDTAFQIHHMHPPMTDADNQPNNQPEPVVDGEAVVDSTADSSESQQPDDSRHSQSNTATRSLARIPLSALSGILVRVRRLHNCIDLLASRLVQMLDAESALQLHHDNTTRRMRRTVTVESTLYQIGTEDGTDDSIWSSAFYRQLSVLLHIDSHLWHLLSTFDVNTCRSDNLPRSSSSHDNRAESGAQASDASLPPPLPPRGSHHPVRFLVPPRGGRLSRHPVDPVRLLAASVSTAGLGTVIPPPGRAPPPPPPTGTTVINLPPSSRPQQSPTANVTNNNTTNTNTTTNTSNSPASSSFVDQYLPCQFGSTATAALLSAAVGGGEVPAGAGSVSFDIGSFIPTTNNPVSSTGSSTTTTTTGQQPVFSSNVLSEMVNRTLDFTFNRLQNATNTTVTSSSSGNNPETVGFRLLDFGSGASGLFSPSPRSSRRANAAPPTPSAPPPPPSDVTAPPPPRWIAPTNDLPASLSAATGSESNPYFVALLDGLVETILLRVVRVAEEVWRRDQSFSATTVVENDESGARHSLDHQQQEKDLSPTDDNDEPKICDPRQCVGFLSDVIDAIRSRLARIRLDDNSLHDFANFDCLYNRITYLVRQLASVGVGAGDLLPTGLANCLMGGRVCDSLSTPSERCLRQRILILVTDAGRREQSWPDIRATLNSTLESILSGILELWTSSTSSAGFGAAFIHSLRLGMFQLLSQTGRLTRQMLEATHLVASGRNIPSTNCHFGPLLVASRNFIDSINDTEDYRFCLTIDRIVRRHTILLLDHPVSVASTSRQPVSTLRGLEEEEEVVLNGTIPMQVDPTNDNSSDTFYDASSCIKQETTNEVESPTSNTINHPPARVAGAGGGLLLGTYQRQSTLWSSSNTRDDDDQTTSCLLEPHYEAPPVTVGSEGRSSQDDDCLPGDWRPVIARDVASLLASSCSANGDGSSSGEMMSDAYVIGMPAKRRKVMEEKARKSRQPPCDLLADCLVDAIHQSSTTTAVGNGNEDVETVVSSSNDLVNAFRSLVTDRIQSRIDRGGDLASNDLVVNSSLARRFPNTLSMFRVNRR